jgi:drug/metabolite transporter (DMT)-like permease
MSSISLGTIIGIVLGSLFICIFIAYKYYQYRIHKASQVQLRPIPEDDEHTYPDRPKGLVLLLAGMAGFCGFFVFFFANQKHGFIDPPKK